MSDRITIYSLTGHRVASSKNLAGVIRHAGRNGLNVVRLRPETDLQSRYAVFFYFHNGDQAQTEWADWRVLLDWLPNRREAPDRLTLPEAIYREARDTGRLARIYKRGTVVTYA